MLAEGYAYLSTYVTLEPAHMDRGRQLAETEAAARASRIGMWHDWLGPKVP